VRRVSKAFKDQLVPIQQSPVLKGHKASKASKVLQVHRGQQGTMELTELTVLTVQWLDLKAQ
jgi:hypothetical protein